MKRLSLLIATGGIVVGCGGEKLVDAEPPSPPLPTFVVSGIVQDEAGQPVVGAIADLVGLGRASVSDASGYFKFSGIRGLVGVRVQKDGFLPQFREFSVTTDVAWNVSLVRMLATEEIVLGATIHSVVQAGAPPCDPHGWDAAAPCRRFQFTPRTSGTLIISINWNGGVPLDAMIVTSTLNYLAISREVDAGMIELNAYVEAGNSYEIRVNAYYGEQVFDLRADLYP